MASASSADDDDDDEPLLLLGVNRSGNMVRSEWAKAWKLVTSLWHPAIHLILLE